MAIEKSRLWSRGYRMTPKSIIAAVVVTSVLLGAGYAQGQGASPHASSRASATIRAEIPKAWLACRSTQDCAAIQFNCSEFLTVNKKYAEPAIKVILENGGEFAWLQCNAARGVAACVRSAASAATAGTGECSAAMRPPAQSANAMGRTR